MTHEDDITIESENESGTDGFGRSKKQVDLKQQLTESQAKAAEHLEGWQRAKADLINFKKETESRQQHVIAHANAALIEDLLPVLDSFSMAMANEEVWNAVDENWRKGIEYTHDQLTKVLTERGLIELNPIDEPFDPNKHEPIEMIGVDSEEQDGIVQKVVQKGYALQDKIIRPARVNVGKFEN